MRVSVCADELTGVAGALLGELERCGHEPLGHGALAEGERHDWAWAAAAPWRQSWERFSMLGSVASRAATQRITRTSSICARSSAAGLSRAEADDAGVFLFEDRPVQQQQIDVPEDL